MKAIRTRVLKVAVSMDANSRARLMCAAAAAAAPRDGPANMIFGDFWIVF